MRIQSSWLTDAATQTVCRALTQQGFQALFVGGCVRNALLKMPVSDIDIATDATPQETIRCAELANLKAIPTGADHGTITIVSAGVAHEVTTFRNDVETDGRHATVRFSKSVNEDAARRDFTMNAIYADPDGTVMDPLNALADLQAGRLRFIGDPEARIREDYLRSLRFFRFTAWYGNPALGIDAVGLAAVSAHLDGLENLSRERVGAELKKLMAAPDPSLAVAAMRSSGVLNAVLQGADDRALSVLVHHEQQLSFAPNSIRRFAVLCDAENAQHLRLSNADLNRWKTLRCEIGSMKPARHLGYLHGAKSAQDILLLRAALLESHVDHQQISETKQGEIAIFPVKAKDLPLISGRALGEKLRALEARWISSDFTLTREDLIK